MSNKLGVKVRLRYCKSSLSLPRIGCIFLVHLFANGFRLQALQQVQPLYQVVQAVNVESIGALPSREGYRFFDFG